MSMLALIKELSENGVFLFEKNGQLGFKLSVDAFPPGLKAKVLENKAELIAFLQQKAPGNAEQEKRQVIEKLGKSEATLSFSQQRLWFLDQLQGKSVEYNMPEALLVTGTFDLEAAESSLAAIIKRHEILRTVYREVDGMAVQRVIPVVNFSISSHDLSSVSEQTVRLNALLEEQARRPFNLAEDVMLRCSYVVLGQNRGALLFNMHHIASDGWSMELLVSEFVTLYRSKVLGETVSQPPLPVQYSDYAHWQRQWLQGDVLSSQLQYWKKQLADMPLEHGLVLDNHRPQVRGYRGARLERKLPADVSKGLERLASEHQLTPFMLVHAAFALVLARHSNREDIVVGTPVANRQQSEVESLIGFFVNTLVLRVDTTARSLRDYLSHVREVHLGAQSNQDVPFEQLVELLQVPRDTTHSPMFQIVLTMQADYGISKGNEQLTLPGLSLSPLSGAKVTSLFDIELDVSISNEGAYLTWIYDVDLFDQERIIQLNDHFERLLTQLSQVPQDIALNELEILSEKERHHLLHALNETVTEYPSGLCIHELYEQCVASTPNAVALVHEGKKLTFSELDKRANRLARYLKQTHSVGPGILVGLCVERSFDLVVGILATLKAGGAYVPMNPAFPDSRLEYMVTDANLGVVLSMQSIAPRLPSGNYSKVILNEFDTQGAISQQSDAPLTRAETGISAQDLAFVIYTSGSTGQPKGVMVEHECVARLAFNETLDYFSNDTVMLFYSNIAFDALTLELWCPVLRGGRAVLHEPIETTPAEINRVIEQNNVNSIWITAGLFSVWAEQLPNTTPLTCIMTGGDVVDPESVKKIQSKLPDILLINCYGPTENTTFSSIYKIPPNFAESNVTIGRPICGDEFYILNNSKQLLPNGVAGELYLGGAGLARGYLNNPELTAYRFIDNPFYDPSLTQSSPRLYRTGDMVRYLSDGKLEFVARTDNQVKVRGFRIEPGEVEHHLNQCNGVDSALVMAVGEGAAQKLVGYIKPEIGIVNQETEAQWLRGIKAWLTENVPAHMVPSVLMAVEEWPLTRNNKVDRRALPSLDSRRLLGEYIAPENDTEIALVGIWATLLKLDREAISTTANFFELGGDSIISIQVVTRGRQAGYHFSVRDLFDTQTIRALAPRVKQQSKVVTEQGEVKGEIPLLPIQSAFFASNLTEPHHYNQSALLETPINLNASHCHTVMRALYQRHDALRLRFSLSKGQWQSHFKPFDDEMLRQSVVLHDLSALTGAARKEALESACQKYQRSLNFVTGPVFRMVYFHYGDSEAGRLLFVCHHLVVDGVSWRILLRDVELAYSQLCEGKNVELGLKTSSVKAWSEALRDYAGSEALQAERDWWVSHLSPEVASLPRSGESDSQEVGRCSLVLDETQTTTLLQTCQRRFKTRINELLLAGLLIAYQRWGGGTCLRVNLEGHGREALFDTLDIGETVGWFTSVYPLMLSCSSEDIEEVLRTVKQVYRELPQRGIGFGMLKYLTQDSALYELDEASFSEGIVFNYLGQFDNTFDSESEFFGAEEFPGDEQSALNGPEQLLSINGSVSGGRLGFELSYAKSAFSNEQAEAFAQAYKQSLVELVEAGATLSGVGALVPTDFPHASLEAEELRSLETTHSDISRLYITTPMQRGMLYHGLLDGTGELYTTISHFDLEGGLDIEVFRKAWQTVVNRHDILRTSIVALEASVPHQLVQESVSLPFNVLDWQDKATATLPAALEALRASEKARGFDFAVAPLMRLTLVCLPEKRYHFIWAHHHILLDGWCQPVLFNEVVQAYQALSTGVELVANAAAPYEDFIAWLASQDEKAALNYWAEHLAGFDSAVSLTDYQNNTPEREGYGEMHLSLSQEESDKLVGLARQSQSTINVLLQFAWSYLLHRYTGESDIVFGATISGRPAHINGIEEMVGLFINTIPVRIQLDSGLTLGEVLGRIHHDNIEREHHGYLSLAEIQGVSDIAPGSSLFETLLVFQNYPTEVVSGTGTHISANSQEESNVFIHASDTREYSNYKLSIISSLEGTLHFKFMYQKAHFSEEMIQKLSSHLNRIMTSLASYDLRGELGELEMLSKEEQRYLLNTLNDTKTDYQSHTCIHELFEQQAERQPDSVAVMFHGDTLSYGELNKHANRLAHYLRNTHNVGPDVLVGLCVERGFEMVVGILAILKAGGAYVPLDPAYPASRLSYMIADAKLEIVVSTQSVESRLSGDNYQTVLLDDPTTVALVSKHCDTPLNASSVGLKPNHLAYVIYTSGSTGQPKGVMVEHQQLCHSTYNRIEHYENMSCFLMLSSVSFDSSVAGLFSSLCSGATLCLPTTLEIEDINLLSDLISKAKVSHMLLIPSLYQALLPMLNSDNKLRGVIVAGEACSANLPAQHQAHEFVNNCELYNEYGPSEATVWSTVARLSPAEEINIGGPLNNTQLYVLDERQQLLLSGSIGELYIGGAGLARGYLNQPELTASRFVKNPFYEADTSNNSVRLYRTGDRVRWLPNGTLAFIGRVDEQLKVRGFRIEPGEVEHQLTQCDGVDSALVITVGESETQQLVGYIRPDTIHKSSDWLQLVKAQLADRLPVHMVPSVLMPLAEWPLTPNGKIDRKSLPALDSRQLGSEFVAPKTDTEKALARIWASLLRLDVDSISSTANFYELGGHSLSIIKMLGQIKTELNIPVAIKSLVEAPNLFELAKTLDSENNSLEEKFKQMNVLDKNEEVVIL
ncbi:amino acid adenylation domain-containing protein [Pseudoalteromonas luteoviolacea]|uniref:non-ribosomal peptide synthetase n=1 Tax=Pseudoalteromonas luteoviolacea TaxID=43657 RepID=UPI001F3E4D04|nr:non-ribosomal peptide synthetase [Pseudoalteromonas luteoviolacea]MCF6442788.1 amino acid adenylation domain-containing protein [Pseudoalteromonas luteoviolacea]